jgi:alpha-glucosidase
MDMRFATGRAGGCLRFVVGQDELPVLPFACPDAPSWHADASVALEIDAERFVLHDNGVPVLAGTCDPNRWAVTIETGNACLYGFGAATGAPDRNDARFRILSLDTLMYAIPGASYTAMPFVLARAQSGAVTGVLFATTLPLDVETTGGEVRISAACDPEGAPVDVIVMRGSMAHVVQSLAAIVGRSLLPPAWALGFHQSRWSYRTEGKVLDVARSLRAHDLPADVVHLDIHYMERYRVFTFHPRRFPDPEGMHAQLRQLGLRTMAIVDPGVSVAPYHAYRALEGGDHLVRTSTGEPFVGIVWPGTTVFPDFFRAETRRVWAQLHRPMIENGVAGFWNDMNDPVFRAGDYYDPLAEDAWHGAIPHRRVRNLYANRMAEATVDALQSARPEQRPFVLSRSGFLGIQRHAAVWTGDNHSSWEHLRESLAMVLNLGLSGAPLSGADVGGFARGPGRLGIFKPRRPSPELFVRWMELGAWLPFFRVHCVHFARSQDPWSFGAAALTQCREVLRRRYRFLPLFYRLALEAHEQGLPLVRPLQMHHDVPDGEGDDQFLLGKSLLVAPVLRAGRRDRDVYLPAGRWVDWHTGAEHAGGRRVNVPAPLGRTPLFVQAGTPIFLAEPRRNADETLAAPLALELTLPSTLEKVRGSLFLDDGSTSRGERFLLEAEACGRENALDLQLDLSESSFAPAQREIAIRVPDGAFSVARIVGERRPLHRLSVETEDRTGYRSVVHVPLAAGTVSFE